LQVLILASFEFVSPSVIVRSLSCWKPAVFADLLTPERLLEIFGLVSGLVCVWLMVKQNVLTFPIGLAYAVASVLVMARNQLYADVLLNAYYVVINAYGWWYWSVKKEELGAELVVSRVTAKTAAGLFAIGVLGVIGMIGLLSNYTSAQQVILNSITTTMSFIAMWMSARKLLENWLIWLLVNVLSVGLYFLQGIYPYALLYTIYLVMAVQGYREWMASMKRSGPADPSFDTSVQ
jgi:nicotinamide mononucleotide transporter